MYKTLILLGAVLLLSGSALMAQNGSRFFLRGSLSHIQAVRTNALTPGMNVMPNVGANLSAGITLSKRWELQIGLQYARRGYTDAFPENDASLPPNQNRIADPIIGCPLPNSPIGSRLVSVRNRVQSLEIPVQMRYYVMHGKKFSLYSLAGMTWHHTLSYSPRTVFEWIESGEREMMEDRMSGMPIRQVNVSGNVGFGISFPMNDRLRFFVQPNADIYIPRWGDQNLTAGWLADTKLDLGMTLRL
ncbi:MAG: hypothetical protein AAF206_00555 [Bacteroidota bacterium]